MFNPRIKKEKKPSLCSCGKELGRRSMTDKCGNCLHILELELTRKLSTPKVLTVRME